jgi:predicted DCC family thiol-disulfide oxidoreductase YuxK
MTLTYPVVRFVLAGQESATFNPTRPYTIVYDGACKVCGRIVRLLKRWDRDELVELVPSQQPGVMARFPWIPARAYSESVQLVGPDGHTWQGAAAVEKIVDLMPHGGFVTWVFSIPFARPLAERFYRWFARNRYRLGCGEHCQYRETDVDHGDREP